MTETHAIFERLGKALQSVVFGQAETTNQLLIALLTGGHVILEGVPGTGKTMMVKVLSQLIQADFRRIQLTPDILPADILGTNIFDLKNQEFILKKGPVFTQILLADEINRTPPKTQSALLEAMACGCPVITSDIPCIREIAGDAAIKVDRTLVDDLEQLFGTYDFSTGCTGFISLGTLGEHANANRAARTVRQVDNAADHLVRVAGVDAEVHRDFDGFIELRRGAFLDQLHGLIEAVSLRAVNAFANLGQTLCNLCHCLTPPPEGPWTGRTRQFHALPRRGRGHSCP